MNINAVFPSKYLKSQEIEGDLVLTISGVEIENVGSAAEPEEKPVIYFEEIEKGFACNKTNANTIAGLYGPETDNWIGNKIALFAQEVDFQGKQVLAIRVRMRKPTVAAKPASKPTPTPGANGTAVARSEAWKAFLAKNPGKSNDELADPWRVLIASIVPERRSPDFTTADWEKVRNRIESDPIGGEKEFEEDSIPF